jgi:CO/xanthine dehydrogenase FAD-binding subunit
VWSVPELRGITVRHEELVIGALSTYTELLEHPVVAAEFPLIGAAARETGAIAIQNRGTIGGNIANASPAADLPPALLAYAAELELAARSGRRRVPYDTFHRGYKKMDLAPEELIVSIHLPRTSQRFRQSYRKVGTRRAQAISKVCFAGVADIVDGVAHEVRLAFGSVAPTVIRARTAESLLRGRVIDRETIASARRALSGDISPIDDLRSTASYRLTVAGNLLEEFLT